MRSAAVGSAPDEAHAEELEIASVGCFSSPQDITDDGAADGEPVAWAPDGPMWWVEPKAMTPLSDGFSDAFAAWAAVGARAAAASSCPGSVGCWSVRPAFAFASCIPVSLRAIES